MKKIMVLCFLSFGWLSCVSAQPLSIQQNADLHQASIDIYSHVDYDRILEKTFPEFIKRVFVTNKKLSQQEIERKVKEYLRNDYLPRLVNNYEILYKKLIAAKKDFAAEGKPEVILPRFSEFSDEGTPQMSREEIAELSLSAGINKKIITVQYYSRRGFEKYWYDPSVEYIFEYKNKKLILVDIKMLKHYDMKQFITGV
jgi:hypothetical protein